MRKYYLILMILGFFACNSKTESIEINKSGKFSGLFKYGNFSDKILFEIEQDSTNCSAFFTSLEQNAYRIPFQDVEVMGDSISFKLQSDFYTYTFKNIWTDNYTKLQGSLMVDTIVADYVLDKEISDNQNLPKSEEINFESEGLTLRGSIWYPIKSNHRGLVFVTSSRNADRSGSRAEAILFTQKGYTTFHFDKRGTGSSQGDWTTATIEELSLDDINAIRHFSSITDIQLSDIGIKGSSQGGSKIPYILNELGALNYGVVVSCPGVSLLESDLNYWKNSNSDAIGNDIEVAQELQRKVFKYIAGELSRVDLEEAVEKEKSNPWFANIWIPNLDEVEIDKKLLYSPIQYFEKVKQPILIVQGTLDEIIPPNSHEIISNALKNANNTDYLTAIEDWINTVSNNK